MPKQSAFDAFCALSQSAFAVPVNPAHALAGAGAGAVVLAGASVDTAGVSANNGAAKINDVAHAIALSLQGFINPPFVKRTRCDARPMQSDIGGIRPRSKGPPHAEQPDGDRCLAHVDRRSASHPNWHRITLDALSRFITSRRRAKSLCAISAVESACDGRSCVGVEKILMGRHASFTYAVGESESPRVLCPKRKRPRKAA